MAQVQGQCDTRFEEVKTLFQSYLDSGEELGASIVVNIDGKDVVDIWGGYVDEGRTREWSKDTIVMVWSTTKAITSLAALILIDRGVLSPYDKVSKYWPEFAVNGKQDVEVRHFLSHTSGVSGWDKFPMEWSEVLDLPTSTALLAQQAPWWTPGTASGYHAITMGHLIGELVRRTTGKGLGQFIREEMAEPLGADFQLGAAESDWPRVADWVPAPASGGGPMPPPSADSVAVKTFRTVFIAPATPKNDTWKRAELGAANGHSNARGVARILSPIALGGAVDGVRLLSPKTIDLIFEEQANGVDLVIGAPFRFGMGFGLPGKDTAAGWLPEQEGRICIWGGAGGSLAIMDLERRMTICYVMNKMENSVLGNDRSKAYVHAMYRAFKGVS